jgi:hypothetical protein
MSWIWIIGAALSWLPFSRAFTESMLSDLETEAADKFIASLVGLCAALLWPLTVPAALVAKLL